MSVTYVESIKLRRPKLSPSEIKRIVKRLNEKSSGGGFVRSVPEGLRIISPSAIPFHGRLGRIVNGALLRNDFAVAVTDADLVWTYTPTTYNLERKSPSTVYHCVDLYAAISGISPKVINEMEKRLASRGVVAIGSSIPVVEHLKEQGFSRVEFWPNVADVEAFKKAPSPVFDQRSGVVFAGHLTSEKLDAKAMINIANVCQARGQKFTLIGPLNVGSGDFRDTLSELTRLGATYLGALPLDQVALECKKHSVGVIPYSDNAYNYGVSPLKLYEYLAAGLSVVSTGLPSIRSVQPQYSQDISVEEPNLFGEVVAIHLEKASLNVDLSRRLDIAEANSWTRRFAEIDDLLLSLGTTQVPPESYG